MDPNETLRAIREATAAGRDGAAAALFADLDHWLVQGGFRPEEWTQHLPPEERRTLQLERRAYRLRNALREAGVPENLVRAVELGGEEPRAELRTDEERREGRNR